MRLFFKAFDSKMASREKLFKAAAEFANAIGRDRLQTLSHSEDRDNIVITIWYWAEEEITPQNLKRAEALKARGAPGSDLPLGLSGGFASLKKPGAEEEPDRSLTPTPPEPPPMDKSLP
jgi:hypothetical protein